MITRVKPDTTSNENKTEQIVKDEIYIPKVKTLHNL
jgi:hypothetical protein